MLIKWKDEIGEVEVTGGTMYTDLNGEVKTGGMCVYGEDLNGEDQAVYIGGLAGIPVHHEATIERLMEDIRKPAVVLRDYIMALRGYQEQPE